MSATVWDKAVSRPNRAVQPMASIGRDSSDMASAIDGLAQLFPRHGVRLSLIRNLGQRIT